MLKLNRIKINGFRRLVDVDLPLHPLCVMIGPNGVGKTSLLDVFSLLAASARGQLNNRLSDFGGIFSILTRDRTSEVELGLDYSEDGEVFHYEILLKTQGFGYEIGRELLSTKTDALLIEREGAIRYKIFANGNGANDLRRGAEPLAHPFESALSQCTWNDAGNAFRIKLSEDFYCSNLNVGPKAAIKFPQNLQPTLLPGSQGEQLISTLYTLRETDRERFETLEDTLRAAFPDFERIDFPPVAAGVVGLLWKSTQFKTPLMMNQLSEGTLRFLWLSTLLLSPKLPSFTMIDEPEVSLHPELLSLLVDLMRGASRRTQLFVATHSDRLIRFLKPEEVLVADMTDEGYAKFTWGSELDLDEWLAEYSLDELWEMKRLGGVP
ncbi:MAG: AAA family ATPase [Planctomycetaceae bacterium]